MTLARPLHLLVAIARGDGVLQTAYDKYLRAQIDNCRALTAASPAQWDMRIVADFLFSYQDVTADHSASTDSRLSHPFAFRYRHLETVLALGRHVWFHDLDLWPLVSFGFPDLGSCVVGIVQGPDELQAGNQFWTPAGLPVVRDLLTELERTGDVHDQGVLTRVLNKPEYRDRVLLLDGRYNLGITRFEERRANAAKPIFCAHFHPEVRSAWATLCMGQSPVVREPLADIFRAHGLFPFARRDQPAPRDERMASRAVTSGI